jgi:hypothetical protein
MPNKEREPKAGDAPSAAGAAFVGPAGTASDAVAQPQISSGPTVEPATKLYLVVEHFKDAIAVYRRLWERGRMAPEGLDFVSVWVAENLERSYRLMRTNDRRLLDEWLANWSDLIDFEVSPVITPEEAGEQVSARLQR